MTLSDADELFCKPRVYPLMQCFTPFYDLRLSFLQKMIRFLDATTKQKQGLIVVDGGCAIGLDIIFLAKHYSGTGMRFHGYDMSKDLISIARARAAKHKLNDIRFQVEHHKHPAGKHYADVLYGVNAFKSEKCDKVRTWIDEILGMTARLKSGGIFIYCGRFGDKEVKKYERCSEALRQFGIIPIITEPVSEGLHLGRYLKAFSHYYQVQRQ